MSFQINHGLFKLDVDDYYAVLGLPINAEPEEVRPRYLKIVQKLHPDTSQINGETEKNLANQILSKLVNPAYKTLSKESDRKEYQLLLSETGRTLTFNSDKGAEKSEIEKEFRKAGANFEKVYRKMIDGIAVDQYDSLQEVIKKIAKLTEVNLIYLKVRPELEDLVKARAKIAVSKQRSAEQESRQAPVDVQTPAQKPPGETPAQKPPAREEKEAPLSPVANYLKRAEEMIEKNNLDRAILDLKDALKLEPNNSSCHGLIGLAYLRSGQMGMAKVHIKKAKQLSPGDAFANQAQQELDQLTGVSNPSAAKKKDKQGKDTKTGKDSKDKKEKSAPTIFGIRLW
jgi:curved DNA-binding protein CbpA